jgi:hypothetical protein
MARDEEEVNIEKGKTYSEYKLRSYKYGLERDKTTMQMKYVKDTTMKE